MLKIPNDASQNQRSADLCLFGKFQGLRLLFCASWQISSEKNMSKALLVLILKPI